VTLKVTLSVHFLTYGLDTSARVLELSRGRRRSQIKTFGVFSSSSCPLISDLGKRE